MWRTCTWCWRGAGALVMTRGNCWGARCPARAISARRRVCGPPVHHRLERNRLRHWAGLGAPGHGGCLVGAGCWALEGARWYLLQVMQESALSLVWAAAVGAGGLTDSITSRDVSEQLAAAAWVLSRSCLACICSMDDGPTDIGNSW